MAPLPAVILLLAVALTSCGPSASSATTPRHGAPTGADERPTDGPAPAASAPTACADEGCFACGDGYCPKGFYCDASLEDGPGCSWLPACQPEARCACVVEALAASCRCSEQSGGAVVTCP